MQDCQNCLLRTQIKFLRNFVENVSLFYIIFGIWTKNYLTFGAKISASLSKLPSGSPRENFEKKNNFFEKKLYVPLHRFWTSGQNFQNFGDNISAHLSKLHFTCPYEEFEKNFLFGKVKLNFIFLNWKKNQAFCRKKTGSSKLHSRCQEERLEKKIFFENTNFLNHFFPWPKKNQFLGWKYLCEQIKLFRSFSDFEMKNSGTKAKKIGTYGKSVFYVYRRTVRWLVLWKKWFSS